MSTTSFVDLSVVKLKDGRIGTVVHLYPKDVAACVEIIDTNELVDVTIDEIDKIIWTPSD